MEKTNKIQLSPVRIIPDALVVWNEPGPDVDVVMDLKKLTFRDHMFDRIYTFHVLDHLFPEETVEAISNWKRCLKTGGRLFVWVDDFEYIARGFVGNDISIDLLNEMHCNPTQFTQESLAKACMKAGFRDTNIISWNGEIVEESLSRKHYELAIHAEKHD